MHCKSLDKSQMLNRGNVKGWGVNYNDACEWGIAETDIGILWA